MSQLALAPLKPEMEPVSTEVIGRQSSMTQAILLSVQVAGLEDKEISAALKIDPGQWSRIKSGTAHFPHDKLDALCDICGNEAPLLWWAAKRGYELRQLETELQRQLRRERDEIDRIQAENKLLRDLLQGRAVA